jgi:RHS repeat-associated protein
VSIFSGSKVIAEYDNGVAVGSPSREYIYGGSALLAKIDSSGTKYYHQDHLSNRLVTSSTGAILAQMGHFPFGESWYNSTGDKLLFTTYERDAESGNDYAMARYYVNRLARFLSLDPLSGDISDPQSLNRFPYTEADPINATDPSELMKCFANCPGWGALMGGGDGGDGGGDDTTYIVDGTVMPSYMNSFFQNMLSLGEAYGCPDIGPNAGCNGIQFSGTSWQRWVIPEVIGFTIFGNGTKVATINTYPGMWIDSPDSDAAIAIGGVGYPASWPGGDRDTVGFKPTVAYTGSVIIPLVGGVLGPAFTGSYVPSQKLACGGFGGGASIGHNIALGAQMVDANNAKEILSGPSFSAGFNATPFQGAQGSINFSGSTGGYSAGIPGGSAAVTYSWCF